MATQLRHPTTTVVSKQASDDKQGNQAIMPPTTSPAVVKASPLINEGGLVHRSRARGLLNADNLPALQNLLKRQPEAYVEEFSAQWNHYQSLRSIFASDLDAGLAIASAGIRINKDQASKFVSLISLSPSSRPRIQRSRVICQTTSPTCSSTTTPHSAPTSAQAASEA